MTTLIYYIIDYVDYVYNIIIKAISVISNSLYIIYIIDYVYIILYIITL